MLRYAARGLPWGRLAAVGVLIALLMEIVRYDPWVMWPMQGTAIGVVAAGCAWCLDEQAAAVADPTPRAVSGQLLARSLGFVPIGAVWVGSVWWARDALFDHPWTVLLQGFAAGAAAAGWVASRRAVGQAEPGNRLALMAVPVATGWALVRPFDSTLPVFPYSDEAWTGSAIGWATVGLVGAVVFVLVLAEAQWWRLQPGGTRRRNSDAPNVVRSAVQTRQ